MAATDPLVDFEKVLLDLQRRGWSYRAIATEIGVSETTAKNYVYHGARPAYDVGESLVKLWMVTTLSTREQLPRLRFAAAR
jgi:ribosome-binding protein aMBF1 (putative translation factor)